MSHWSLQRCLSQSQMCWENFLLRRRLHHCPSRSLLACNTQLQPTAAAVHKNRICWNAWKTVYTLVHRTGIWVGSLWQHLDRLPWSVQGHMTTKVVLYLFTRTTADNKPNCWWSRHSKYTCIMFNIVSDLNWNWLFYLTAKLNSVSHPCNP